MFGIAEGFYCVVVPGTMGGPRHGKAETALRAAPAGRGDSTRLTRLCSLSAGPSVDTKLVLCRGRCVRCSPLTMQRLLVSPRRVGLHARVVLHHVQTHVMRRDAMPTAVWPPQVSRFPAGG